MNTCGDASSCLDESVVAVLRCEDYDAQRVGECVARGVELLGGVRQFITPGERLLLKPNMLEGKAPEKAVTTHPAVFEAVARLFLDAGAVLTYGDSPGFGRPSSVARRCGIGPVADALGIPLAEFQAGRTLSFPEGHLCKQFTVAEGALQADGIISLPKLKTHALTRLTGAVKNPFACVPGMLKGEFHARLHEMEHFATMLVDLSRCLAPRLHVMDGIVAMEGNGPNNGRPRPLGVLLLSTDPVALDAVACRIIDLEPRLVPPLVQGDRLGLGTSSRIRTVGESVSSFACPDFDVNRKADWHTDAMQGWLSKLMRDRLTPRPVIAGDRCTRCGTCVGVCPVSPKALSFPEATHTTPPAYTYSRCIRCYCCQEMCPDNAIEVRTPLLGRLIHR